LGPERARRRFNHRGIAASHPGHVYKGLAYANNGSGNFIYAADFANGHIDVFNSSFALQTLASFPFADATIPSTPGNTYYPLTFKPSEDRCM
jgi:hypothetical protein